MSRAFGRVFQVAYVVEDIEAHIDHWVKVMGVGPFYRFPIPRPIEELKIDDKPAAPDTDLFAGVALSYSGDTMIELIQPGSAPSTYREFLDSGRRGVHHLGTFTDDYDNQMAAARAAGIEVALEGVLPLSRFAYLKTDLLCPGTIVEVIEPQQAMLDLFGTIRQAAAEWDGQERIRTL
jgi:hypothetical protein